VSPTYKEHTQIYILSNSLTSAVREQIAFLQKTVTSDDKYDKSLLPLTYPREVVPHAHRVVHRCKQSVW